MSGYDSIKDGATIDELLDKASTALQPGDVSPQIVYCSYSITTYSEVSAILAERKIPVVIYQDRLHIYFNTSGGFHYFTCTYATFTYYVRVKEGSATWTQSSAVLEGTLNKVKALSNSSTDSQYPSAKCVYDALQAVEQQVKITTSKTHAVIAQGYGINWTAPPTGVSTPGVALTIEPYSMSVDALNDGDTILMQIPNTLTNTSGYPLYFQIDATRGTEAGNLIPIIRGQSAGTPVQWLASTTLTNGFYMFVYSTKLGGLIFMYRNTTTNG